MTQQYDALRMATRESILNAAVRRRWHDYRAQVAPGGRGH